MQNACGERVSESLIYISRPSPYSILSRRPFLEDSLIGNDVPAMVLLVLSKFELVTTFVMRAFQVSFGAWREYLSAHTATVWEYLIRGLPKEPSASL